MMNILSKIAIIFLIVVAILAVMQPAEASPSDLITTPTAGIIPGQGSVGAERIGGSTRIYGLFKLENFVEIGGDVWERSGSPELGVLLKTRLLTEKEGRPEVSIGIRSRSLYIVGSKTVVPNTRFHFGFSDRSMGGIFVGAETVLNPYQVEIVDEEGAEGFALPRTRLMVEYIDQAFNFGGLMNITQELTAELAILDMSSVKAGVQFNF